jgi:hypothetical protein
MIPGLGDRGVTDTCVDCVAVGQRAVEYDAGAKRLDRLVARMGEGRRWLEGDARSTIAEGEVCCIVELEPGS